MLLILSLLGIITSAYGCRRVEMHSKVMGTIVMSQIPLDSGELNVLTVGGGRPSYSAYDEQLKKSYYLYHSVSDKTSTGMWVFNDEFGVTGHAIAYRLSWSITPNLIDQVNDDKNNAWIVPSGADNSEWSYDFSMKFICLDENPNYSAVYFESSSVQPTLTGFYVERVVSTTNKYQGLVYSHIPQHQSIEQSYLYKLDELWMIGEDYGIDSGFAYIESSASYPHEIESKEWNFVRRDNSGAWSKDSAFIFHRSVPTNIDQGIHEFSSIYEAIRYVHSLKYVPKGQEFLLLRNLVPVPILGLGTGGIRSDIAHEVFREAIQLGYRFFDLAREYGNEYVLPEVFEADQESLGVGRENIFIQSKVWPTDLGFHPTMDAILVSLDLLKTSYIDGYMLHWPRCIPEWSWMHCDTTVDPDGNWKESWRALEKAYSEGLLNSIGVSNFDVALLRELEEFAIIRPHYVQNFAEPGQMDLEVRRYCTENKIVYQPYASGRNIRSLPTVIQNILGDIARKHSKSVYAVILRFFVQTGNLIAIPRSNNAEHLRDNAQVFNWKLDASDMASLGWADDSSNEL